jgi:hypothetical protein
VKRLATVAIVLVALAVGVTSAEAANDSPTVSKFPVSFVMSSTTVVGDKSGCQYLPPGATVTGSGKGTSITTVRTHDNGVTTVANVTHEHGTATDQDSNTYVFNYNNEFRASNTVAHRDVFSGLMIDTFSLAGHGPARLNNGFVAKVTTTDFVAFSFKPLHAHGDPIDFATGQAHCDPL